MRRYIGWALLIAEGLLVLGMEILGVKIPGAFTSAMAFPYEQAAGLLRSMSLSGKAGNAWAWVIYATICLLPVIYWALFRARKGFRAADALLFVMTGALFGGLYIMINPGHLPAGLGVETERAIVGCALHSVWMGYAVLRLPEIVLKGGRARSAACLKGLLWVMAAVFVYVIAGSNVKEAIEAFRNLAEKNTMPGTDLLPTRIFICLGCINSALPCAMNLPVIGAAMGFLSADKYSEDAVMWAEKLSRRCVRALTVTVIASAAYNILQLVFAGKLLIVNAAVEIPLVTVIFASGALMAAGYVRAGMRLKQDNDLFI